MLKPIRKQRNSFIVQLNKALYKGEIVKRAIDEDKEWISLSKPVGRYLPVELKTQDLDDVLNWLNYLLYLHKSS
ncbi:MAG: hypothetical protein ISS47_07785 [Candidatus Omnitrophica bacterium]|nr:hypothetical protein [Candidatus Omnitrophota bacterium]